MSRVYSSIIQTPKDLNKIQAVNKKRQLFPDSWPTSPSLLTLPSVLGPIFYVTHLKQSLSPCLQYSALWLGWGNFNLIPFRGGPLEVFVVFYLSNTLFLTTSRLSQTFPTSQARLTHVQSLFTWNFLHFSPVRSHDSICYYHQDLH